MEALKNYQILKSELKQLASELRIDKVEIKKTQKEGGIAGGLQFSILGKKSDCRHKHIAYSMMRGRTYEQIESKCRKGNEPDQNLIQEIIRAYGTTNVCSCA